MHRFIHRVFLVTMLLACTSLSAAELYRLRIHAPEEVAPGQVITAIIVADITAFPLDGSTIPAPGIGIGFGLTIPQGLEYLGTTWSDAIDTSASDFVDARLQTGDLHAMVLNGQLFSGISQQLAEVQFQVNANATAGDSFDFEFLNTSGFPVLLTTGGAVTPHTRGASMVVGANFIAASQAEVDFPEPTTAELSSSVGNGGTEGASSSTEFYCNYPDKEQLSTLNYVEVNATLASMSVNFDFYKVQSTPTIIWIASGSFFGVIDLDLLGMVNPHIIIASRQGPESAKIVGSVRIFGIADPSSKLSFGWHEASTIDINSPVGSVFIPATWQTFENNWLGFEITGGVPIPIPTAPLFTSNGVIVNHRQGTVEVRGNVIHNNALPPFFGGGLTAYESSYTFVVRNHIEGNSATAGGGIAVVERLYSRLEGKVTIAKNYILGNAASGNGGGIYAVKQSTDICQNMIFNNQARSGCGIYWEFLPTTSPATQVIYIEENYVHDNQSPASGLVDDVGGGIAIRMDSAALDTEDYNFALIRNRIFDNALNDEVKQGGGLYVEGLYRGSPGPFGVISQSPGGQLIIGNSVWDNDAESDGGGIYAAITGDTVDKVLIYSNTIWQNDLFQIGGEKGYGLFLQGNNILSSSAIIQQNSALAIAEWYVQAGVGGPIALSGFSATPDNGPGGTAHSPDPYQGPSSVLASAQFLAVADPRNKTHQLVASPTINTGETAIQASLPQPTLKLDFDNEPRVDVSSGMMDIGADEYVLGIFRRGDANDDSMVDIADGIFILNALFIPGQPYPTCEDTADTNDSGSLDIADAVYLLDYLFLMGPPPPPAPFPNCGFDPTNDSLFCGIYLSCP